MAQIEIEPLMVKGKAEDGTEVEVNVGFQADYSISVAFIFSDVFEDNAATVIQFPKEHFGTYLKEYIPGAELED